MSLSIRTGGGAARVALRPVWRWPVWRWPVWRCGAC